MRERALHGLPNGEVFSEAALGVRNAVKAGHMTVEKHWSFQKEHIERL